MTLLSAINKSPVRSYSELSEHLTRDLKQSFLGRHVAWLKQDSKGIEKVGKTFLIYIELFISCLSVVGVIAVVEGLDASRKLDNYNLLKNKVTLNPLVPPAIATVAARSKLTSFNHMSEFAIHDGALWHKPIGNRTAEAWELMYYEGYLDKNQILDSLSADGANLAVVSRMEKVASESIKIVHYKKIIDEPYRFWMFNQRYIAKDVASKDNWYDRWFSFPIIQNIYHLFREKLIALPKDCISYSMSHRGKYVRHYNARNGSKHPEFTMVTSLTAVHASDPSHFYIADPYLWNRFGTKIPGPPNVQIKHISSSASTHFISGEESESSCFYTINGDFDSFGLNPMLASFYFKGWRSDEYWKKHLPPVLAEGSTLNKNEISIHQCGEGNESRILKIGGTQADVAGHYTKYIDASMNNAKNGWEFVPSDRSKFLLIP